MKLSKTAIKALRYMAAGYTLTSYGYSISSAQSCIEPTPGVMRGYAFGVQPSVMWSLVENECVVEDRAADYTWTNPSTGKPMAVHALHYRLTDVGRAAIAA